MKALSASMLAVIVAALPMSASTAGGDKTLQNIKGSVTYGASETPTNPLALHSSATLSDNDYASTGADSQATIALPDSSKLLMGQNSRVQMQSFDVISGVNTAKFVVVGKVRFAVEHPAGAQANYQFTTATGQIAVRGTIGDIAAGPNNLQVSVYAVSNPALPVQVTLVNGQVFTLAAGQSLVATGVAGAVTATVGSTTSSLSSTFSELGSVNTSAGAAGLGTTTAATTAATTTAATTTAAAVAAGTAAAVTVANSSSSAAPSPTASPTAEPSDVNVGVCVSLRARPNDATPCPSPSTSPDVIRPRIPSRPGSRPGGGQPSPRP